MRAISFIVLCLLIIACFPEKQEHKDEVVFKDATFGLEALTQKTIETTLRHTELYIKLGSNDKKYFQGPESSYFGYFPTDSAVIRKISAVLIDTTVRDPNHYPPSQQMQTLYLSPSDFTKEEYQRTVDFLRSEYTKPDKENKMLHWLNYSGQPVMDTILWRTIYAVAYVDLALLQPTLKGEDENHWATILVNQTVDVSGNIEGGLQMRTSFFIRQDTLFYHKTDDGLFQQFKTYKDNSGKTIAAYCKATNATNNIERFYMPPFQ